MTDSAGSAENELKIYQESAEYLFNQFKETFTSIAQNAIKRDDLKNLIKFGTSLLGIVNGIVEKVGLLPAILTTIIGIIASKKTTKGGIFGVDERGNFTAFGSKVGKNSGWFSNVFGGKKTSTQQAAQYKAQIAEINNAQKAIDAYSFALAKGKDTTAQFSQMVNHSNPIVRQCAQAINMGADEADACSKANARLGNSYQKVTQDASKAGVKISGVGVKLKQFVAGFGNTLVSMGTAMLVSTAINLLIKGISDGIKSIENHINKISELTEKEKSLKSEIENLNSELGDTKLRIVELEKMPKLTLLEQDELNRLKESNDELERQIRLKRGELAEATSTANDEAQKLWKEMTTNSAQRLDWWDFLGLVTPGVGGIVDGIVDAYNGINKNFFDQQKQDLDKYKKKLEELNELKESDEYKKGSKKATKQFNKLQDDLKELHDKIQKYYNGSWSKLSTGLDPALNENKEILDQVNQLINEWDELNTHINKTFEEVYNDGRFAGVKQQLEDLAKAGELTAEKFAELTDDEVAGIEEFKKALEDIDGTTFEKVVESINKKAEEVKKSLDSATTSVEAFTEALEKLEGIVSKQETLADIFKKIQLNGFLSPKETKELLKEMPDLLEYLERTAKGYTISAENIKAANKGIIKSEKEKLGNQIVNLKTQIGELEKLDKLGIELDNSNGKDADLANRFFEQSEKTEALREKLGIKSMGEISNGIAKLEEELKKSEFQLNLLEQGFDGLVIDDVFDDAKSAVLNYNKEIQVLDSAIKELGEGASLSYDEMVNLVDIAPELEKNNLIEDLGNGKYSIEIKQLEDLRKKRYEVRNEYIDGLIKQGKAELEAAKDAKLACETILNLQKKWGNEAEQLAAQIELDAADIAVKQIEDAISKFEAMKKELTVTDTIGTNNASDPLQNQIDYYKTIISAIEIMRDKYSEAFEKEKEALENEKKALQEGKDALKEANDERQREINLREAIINLENAKKRKVWVYSEGKGFQQVQDEGAVKEASEKYRDAVTDIQEAEIDKKIAELDKKIEANEKQQEAFEKSLEDMTNLEKNIEDAKTVEQAKTALGLADEKDLLNLSDAVKEGIKNGLAEAIIEKDNEENKGKVDKNGNSLYTPVTLDDVLKSLGASVTAEDLKSVKNDIPTQAAYDAAVKDFVDSLNNFTENAVSSVVNNNGGVVISPTFNIYDANNPEEIAKVVNSEMTNLLTRYNNSIK